MIEELNVSDTRSWYDLALYVNNTATEGLFFPTFLLGIWVIIFITMLTFRQPSSRAWTMASFFCTVLAVPLALMNFLSRTNLYMVGLFLAVGVFWMVLENRKE